MKGNNNDAFKRFAKWATIGIALAVFLLAIGIPAVETISIHVGDFLIDYIDAHPVGSFIVAAIVGYISYSVYHASPEENVEAEPAPEPTMSDYFTILDTIRPAVAEVAQALGLAPVYSHTDMAADQEERILPWGRVWGMKYKALKQSGTANFDTELAERVLQAQVKTVLERDNPSRFANTKYLYRGCAEPVVQIAEVRNGDAFIYIFVVLATSDTYFRDKADGTRKNTVLMESDTTDEDFGHGAHS